MKIRTELKQGSRAHLGAVAWPLAALCGVLVIGVGLLVVFRRSAEAPMLAGALVPTMVLLALWIYRRAHALHSHARHHAETAAEAEQHYFRVLREVVKVIEGRNRFIAGRSERISRLVVQMAETLGLDAERAGLLGMVAQVHDIGLLSVPEQILLKPGGLDGQEYNAVKKHCQAGESILQPLTFLGPVLAAVRNHHERMNGTGYPDGLAGADIPVEARILGVADSYDAMTHDRPHRGALAPRRALGELVRCAGSGYDPDCVAALADAVNMADLLSDDLQDGGEPDDTPTQDVPGSAQAAEQMAVRSA